MFFNSRKRDTVVEEEVEVQVAVVKPAVGVVDIQPIIDFIKANPVVKFSTGVYMREHGFRTNYRDTVSRNLEFEDKVISITRRYGLFETIDSDPRTSHTITVYALTNSHGQLDLFADNKSMGLVGNIKCDDVSVAQFGELNLLFDRLFAADSLRAKTERYDSILGLFQ